MSSHLKRDAISEARVGTSHHAQDPGYLTGCYLSHPILNYYVSALIRTRETQHTNRLVLTIINHLQHSYVNKATIKTA